MIKIKPIESIAVGVTLAILLSIPMSALLSVLVSKYFGFWVYYAAALAAASGITLFGGVRLDVAHNGVLLFLGKRIEKILFEEGLHWIPPFICEMEEVSVKEYTTDVPETKFVSKNKVEMKGDSSIQWRVINPFSVLSLGTEDKTGENVVEDGLKLLLHHFLRSDGRLFTDEELMDDTGNISERIMAMLNAPGPDGTIEDRWGIHILNVLVSGVLPTDPKVLDAYERARIEAQEKEAETTESEFFIKRVLKIAKDTGMSPEIAGAFFASERGKAPPYHRIEVTGSGRAIVMTGTGGGSITPSSHKKEGGE
ncbi:MAG: SPFH domain-containing protein [Patescibacteria group bacterium]